VTEPSAIRVERHVAAPPSTVFAYLTSSERWARWQGADATIDAVPGGLFRMRMGTGQTARGQFVTVVPDERVVFTWGWIDRPEIPPGSTVVDIELIPTDEGTLIRLTHRELAAEEMPAHEVGWQHYLARLAVVAAGGDPGPDEGPA
jgi:uncharacterized protein YndB with AHSA1/START domain